MTTEHRIVCGAAAQNDQKGHLFLRIDEVDVHAELKVSHLRRHFLKEMPDILADLLEVAAYVYAADSAISRGGPVASQMGHDWRRSLQFEVPVRRREIWEDPTTHRLLTETLGFLSEDTYSFAFHDHPRHGVEAAIPFLDLSEDDAWRPDEVIMFSGGLDSLAGALEAVLDRQNRVALVSHSSAPVMTRVQRELANVLAGMGREGRPDRVRHFPIRARMQDRALKEGSHRSRSFLFATLGVVIARSFGLDRIDFCENGIVSLNLPVLAQHVGTRATRSTHPQALKGLGELFTALLGDTVRIGNPLFWKTKTDVLYRIRQLGRADLIKRSRSCANVRRTSRMHPHCGRCSQCIDRRFAALAAELGDDDPSEAYEVDLLEGPREGQDRELALAYVRNARRVRAITPSELTQVFPEVSRALESLDLDPSVASNRIVDLLRRHGKAVTDVMERALDAPERPPGSLLDLYAAPDEVPSYRHALKLEPEPFKLLIEIDDQNQWAKLNRAVTVRKTLFLTIETFAASHLASLSQGLAPEDYDLLRARDLQKSWGLEEQSTVRRRIQNLRSVLDKEFGEGASDILENQPWYGYRLRPESVTIHKVDLGRPPSG